MHLKQHTTQQIEKIKATCVSKQLDPRPQCKLCCMSIVYEHCREEGGVVFYIPDKTLQFPQFYTNKLNLERVALFRPHMSYLMQMLSAPGHLVQVGPAWGRARISIHYICHFFSTEKILGSIFLHIETA